MTSTKTAALAHCNIRCSCACLIAITDECWRPSDAAEPLKDGSTCFQQTCPERMRASDVCENTHMLTIAVNETDASLGLFTVTKRRHHCCTQHAKAHSQRCVFFGYLFFHTMMRADLSGVPAQQFTQKRAMLLLAHSRRMLQKQHAGASGA